MLVNKHTRNLRRCQGINANLNDMNRIEHIAGRIAIKYKDEGIVDGFWGSSASGFLFTTGTSILLLRRSGTEQSGTWGIPGGAIPIDKTGNPKNTLRSALDEVREEIGQSPKYTLIGKTIFKNGDFTYTTFIARVGIEFIPRLNWEHDDYIWATENNLPSPLHPGISYILSQFNPFLNLSIP